MARSMGWLPPRPPVVVPVVEGPADGIESFAYDGPRPDLGRAPLPIEDLFWNNEGPLVHKWLHYLPIYERHFAKYRGTAFRMLEIGVSKGGSLEMWRKYFGPEATIFGIDIDPDCARFDGQSAQVRIGSQDDPAFLASVVEEMGGVDVVLDDGSHVMRHLHASLDVLYPLLSDGGTYMVEDLHTAYWTGFEGGYRAEGSFIETAKSVIDDMHHWYHERGQVVPGLADKVGSMHVYDSIVVFEKAQVKRPVTVMRGTA